MTGNDSPDNTKLSEMVSITVSRRAAVMLGALYTEHVHRMSGRKDSAVMSTLIAGSARLSMSEEEAKHFHDTMGTLFKSQDCVDITSAGPFPAVLLVMSITSDEQVDKDSSETFAENILKNLKEHGL